MLKLPANKICADCTSKGPRWAVINMGIFVCVNCSAVHRRMGTHISKVKSTNLDDWNTNWVQFSKAWGNIKANAYWESEFPDYETK